MPCAGCRRSREVTVVLEDHYTGDEINGALGRGEAFAGAFPGETEGELDALRELFHRKALVARQSRLCEELAGRPARRAEEVTALRVADLPDDPGARRCLELRAHLGIPSRRRRRRRSCGPTASRSRPPT